MTITFRRAIRADIPLLVGLAGGTGSGKTKSMLELLKGMTPEGKRFAVIDTENGRSRHYAHQYDFDVHELHQFRPADYLSAICAADEAGYAAIGVDSLSHEWTDGVLGWQEEEFERLGEREATRLLSWKEPKRAHKSLVSGLLQLRAHCVLCFRAEPKVEMTRRDGRTVVEAKEGAGGYNGWFPITDSRLHFELTAYLMLLSDEPGKPKPIKLYDELRPIFPDDQFISAESGRRLAEWSRGNAGQVGENALKSFRDKLTELGITEAKALDFAGWTSLEGHPRNELADLLASLKATTATGSVPAPKPQEAML